MYSSHSFWTFTAKVKYSFLQRVSKHLHEILNVVFVCYLEMASCRQKVPIHWNSLKYSWKGIIIPMYLSILWHTKGNLSHPANRSKHHTDILKQDGYAPIARVELKEVTQNKWNFLWRTTWNYPSEQRFHHNISITLVLVVLCSIIWQWNECLHLVYSAKIE